MTGPVARRPKRTRRTILTLIALSTAAGCLGTGSVTAPSLRGEGRRALFIGNSYLYTQDIPGLVQAMAAAGGEPIAVATIASPDVALVDHWRFGNARREIERGGWEWVVLQQGPSSVGVNRDTLVLGARLFADRIRAVNATPALFSAWPAASRRQDFPRAIESYQIAATDVDGIFLPVASSWLAAWERDTSLALYADGLHASTAGAYLSAAVVYACLLHASPVGLPATLDVIGSGTFSVPPALATLLQEAAAEVVAQDCEHVQPPSIRS